MKFAKMGTAGVVAVAIGLTALLAYPAAQGSSGDRVTASAGEVARAEAAIARSNLAGRLEATLGRAFGGVWFEPSTAQLHVGVTSPVSRRSAEAVAARAGLAGTVTETPVDSPWMLLAAVQKEWNHRLADLFEREEVKTSLVPDLNSVKIELGASVPRSRLAALRRNAANDDVDVSIVVAPFSHFRIELQARCGVFAADKANCETPIVAGVTIESETVKSKKTLCTAGPPVVLTNPSNQATRTEVFVLTAGHCIKDWGGVGGWWSAFKKVDGKEALIGKAVQYLYPKTDVGVINVGNPGHWTSEGSAPVTPTLALWEAKESEPTNITGETKPVKGIETCISGQSSGMKCGKIKETGVSHDGGENLVEVEGVATIVGDSGAPWYAKGSPSIIEGTHKGLSPTGNPLFVPLEVSLKELKAQKGLDLELLAKGDEIRHPTFTAEEYPVTVSANDSTSEDEFTAFGGTMECTQHEFDGEVTEAEQTEEPSVIAVTPAYSDCTAGLGLPVKAFTNECEYELMLNERVAEDHYSASVDVVCPEGQPGIQFRIYPDHPSLTSETALCTLTVLPQSGLEVATLTNSSGNIVVDGPIEGVEEEMHPDSIFCPFETTETTSGIYHLNEPLTISGTSGKEAVEIDIAGE